MTEPNDITGFLIDTPFQYRDTPGTAEDHKGIYALVDAQGHQIVVGTVVTSGAAGGSVISGTVQTIGTEQVIGTLALASGTITSLPAVTGTVQAVGTSGVVGTVQSVGTSQVVGTVSTGTTPVTLEDLGAQLKILVGLTARPMSANPATGKVQTEPAITSGVITTVTGLTNIGGFNAQTFLLDTMRTTWATCVRPRIT